MSYDGLAGPSHSPLLPRLGRTRCRCPPRPRLHLRGPQCLLLRWRGPQRKEDLLLQPLEIESICLKLACVLYTQTEDAEAVSQR
jgi:hypothetical protein